MRLIEVVEGDDTAPETAQAAINFAQAIRKTPIRCAEAPGFVVNRILNSAVSELWRFQEETGIDVKELDRAGAPIPKPRRSDRSSSPTCSGSTPSCTWPSTCTSAYGERFYVHRDAGAGRRRQARRQDREGFYEHGG